MKCKCEGKIKKSHICGVSNSKFLWGDVIYEFIAGKLDRVRSYKSINGENWWNDVLIIYKENGE